MKKAPVKPYIPSINMEDLMDFDPQKPETFTDSRLVNDVMAAIHEVRPLKVKNVADYLGLDDVKLTHALEILTGHSFSEIHKEWHLKELARIENEHPDWSNDQIAHEMGLADRSVIWNMRHTGAHKKYRERLHRHMYR